MSYRIEGKDIVISGFENGLSESVYSGAAEMRNIELITVPGEASVPASLVAVTTPVVWSAIAFTAQNTGDTITVASTTGLYEGTAIVLNTNTAGGLSTNQVYYAHTITSTTFKLRLAPATGATVNVSSDGSGTLSSYQYGGTGSPVSYFVDRRGSLAGANSTFLVDASNHVWVILTAAQAGMAANTLFFLGNIGTTQSSPESGLAIWNSYLILFAGNDVDVADIGDLWAGSGPLAAWDYQWQTSSGASSTNSRIAVLVSQEDGNLYYQSDDGLGSIIETPGDVFDPTDANSYTFTEDALLVPATDESTCIAELGINLLIGGRNNFVYVWNKIDPGFSTLLNIPDTFITFIVASSQNAYVFAGIRGRIYITNGSGIELYKKVPDYLTGIMNPLIRWRDASFGRNQVYFGFTGVNSSGTTLDSTNGIWAIDLETEALRMINKRVLSGYTGIPTMTAERPSSNSGTPTAGLNGTGLQLGWYTSTGGGSVGVDVSQPNPYTDYESFIETEMIPVGTYLDQFTPSQIEWKTSAALVSGEGIRISYRTKISDSYTQIGESTTAGVISDMYKANFQKAQWVQFKIELKSTVTNPSYTRLTEMRIRDWPSGKNMPNK